ncbi:isoprenylcysteine carboxylmethyltransferase family protein [Sinomonas sp. P47F7]|uniref:methyltransferase family protein n=1 Tax=Sinomonas sp. P47F7 TaxID=3410987 RepID=UPI003BF4D4A0
MPDALAWVTAAALLGVTELAFAARGGRGAPAEAVAMDHVMKAATLLSFLGPALMAPLMARPLPVVVGAGFALALGGVAVRLAAMVTLRGRYRLTPQRQSSDHYLVRRGPYALVRHPGYVGILAALSGMALTAAGPGGLIFVVPVAVFCVLRIAGEERLLREEFNTDFSDYCRAVRWRLVPWLY